MELFALKHRREIMTMRRIEYPPGRPANMYPEQDNLLPHFRGFLRALEETGDITPAGVSHIMLLVQPKKAGERSGGTRGSRADVPDTRDESTAESSRCSGGGCGMP